MMARTAVPKACLAGVAAVSAVTAAPPTSSLAVDRATGGQRPTQIHLAILRELPAAAAHRREGMASGSVIDPSSLRCFSKAVVGRRFVAVSGGFSLPLTLLAITPAKRTIDNAVDSRVA